MSLNLFRLRKVDSTPQMLLWDIIIACFYRSVGNVKQSKDPCSLKNSWMNLFIEPSKSWDPKHIQLPSWLKFPREFIPSGSLKITIQCTLPQRSSESLLQPASTVPVYQQLIQGKSNLQLLTHFQHKSTAWLDQQIIQICSLKLKGC